MQHVRRRHISWPSYRMYRRAARHNSALPDAEAEPQIWSCFHVYRRRYGTCGDSRKRGVKMEYKNIIVEVKDGIGFLKINRPKALNALNSETCLEVKHAGDTLNADKNVRVVIV